MAERTTRGDAERQEEDERMTNGEPIGRAKQGTASGTQTPRDKGKSAARDDEPAADSHRQASGDGEAG